MSFLERTGHKLTLPNTMDIRAKVRESRGKCSTVKWVGASLQPERKHTVREGKKDRISRWF